METSKSEKAKKKNTSLEHMMKFKNYIQYTYLWVNKTKKKNVTNMNKAIPRNQNINTPNYKTRPWMESTTIQKHTQTNAYTEESYIQTTDFKQKKKKKTLKIFSQYKPWCHESSTINHPYIG